MLQDKTLSVFLAVVETGSFTAAARRLGCSQPAVSSQIASLEAALDLQLFERGRELVLTPSGEAFLPYARRIQAAYDLADEAFCSVFSK